MENGLLNYLCDNLQESLRQAEMLDKKPPTSTVTLFSGWKEVGYFYPRLDDEIVQLAWHVEIFVNNNCLFRESYIPKENEDIEIVEGMVMQRVLNSVFHYGVMAVKKISETPNLA